MNHGRTLKTIYKSNSSKKKKIRNFLIKKVLVKISVDKINFQEFFLIIFMN